MDGIHPYADAAPPMMGAIGLALVIQGDMRGGELLGRAAVQRNAEAQLPIKLPSLPDDGEIVGFLGSASANLLRIGNQVAISATAFDAQEALSGDNDVLAHLKDTVRAPAEVVARTNRFLKRLLARRPRLSIAQQEAFTRRALDRVPLHKGFLIFRAALGLGRKTDVKIARWLASLIVCADPDDPAGWRVLVTAEAAAQGEFRKLLDSMREYQSGAALAGLLRSAAMLAWAARDRGRAVELLREAQVIDPGGDRETGVLVLALVTSGAFDEASRLLQTIDPSHVGGHEASLARLILLRREGRVTEAVALSDELLDRHPSPQALAFASGLVFDRGDLGRARELSRRALQNLRANGKTRRSAEGRIRMGCLAALGPGVLKLTDLAAITLNSGLTNLAEISDRHFDVETVWVPSDDIRAFDGFDVIVNTLSDPDSMSEELKFLGKALSGKRNVVNAPKGILMTRRDLISRLAAPEVGIIVPATFRIEEPLPAPPAPLQYPIILRKAGSHNGHTTLLCSDDRDWKNYLQDAAREPVYATQFLDCRDGRGWFAKARAYVIGGEVMPEHFIVSPSWSVHGTAATRAFMDANPTTRDSERAFLAGFERQHPPIIDYLTGLARILALDVFMADFGFDRKGNTVIFEVNASMRLIEDHELALEGHYLQPYVHQIRQAINRVFAAKAAAR